MTNPLTPRIRFFLSHSMKDQAVVELLREQIEALGVHLYLAEHDPQPGRPLAEKVIEAIKHCDATVVLLTEAGAAAPFVQQEIGVARGAGKLIIPIVQKGIDGNMLAMLAGVERIEVDFAEPAQALAAVGANLEPLVQSQVAQMPTAAKAAGSSNEILVLAGLGVLVLALLIMLNRSS